MTTDAAWTLAADVYALAHDLPWDALDYDGRDGEVIDKIAALLRERPC